MSVIEGGNVLRRHVTPRVVTRKRTRAQRECFRQSVFDGQGRTHVPTPTECLLRLFIYFIVLASAGEGLKLSVKTKE